MSTPAAARRLLLVHAHPDDETTGTGAAMARYVAEGAHVTLVTCTLGEEGEVLVPGLAHLAAAEGDQLGGYRYHELSLAMQELGVTDYRLLGGPGRWRDSGMMGLPTNDVPRAFWQADLEGGDGRAGRGRARGPPAGPGHLRRERRVRPPGPHPVPPGRDGRGGRRGRPGVRPGDRRPVVGAQGLLERAAALGHPARHRRHDRGGGVEPVRRHARPTSWSSWCRTRS